MKYTPHIIGKLGEDAVIKYAKNNKWKIITRNFRKPWGEIDIVARNKKTILFIEVKSQSSEVSKLFKPEDHFDYRKKQRLIRTCKSYLAENNYLQDTDFRIDLAAVEIDRSTNVARIRYYKNAIG